MAKLMIGWKHAAHGLVWASLMTAITATAATLPSATLRDADQVDQAIRTWAQSWDRGDVAQYLNHYADNFVPAGGMSRSQWEHQRRYRLKTSAIRQVMLRNIEVAVEANTARAQFTQHYLDLDQISTARKHLTLIKQAGAWKIREEQIEAERLVRR